MGLSIRSGNFGEYWGNDYYSSTALNLDQMKINARYIADSLLAYGWSLNAIAGMLGNMQSESSINPGRWENNSVEGDPEGHGYGLVQWTPYTKYTNWARNLGYDPSTMDSNLERINYEVENNIQWISTSSFPLSFTEFKISEDTPYNLALAFLANYERPADPIQPSRGTQAEFWYEFLSGGPSPEIKKKKFKWVLYARKLRDRR